MAEFKHEEIKAVESAGSSESKKVQVPFFIGSVPAQNANIKKENEDVAVNSESTVQQVLPTLGNKNLENEKTEKNSENVDKKEETLDFKQKPKKKDSFKYNPSGEMYIKDKAEHEGIEKEVGNYTTPDDKRKQREMNEKLEKEHQALLEKVEAQSNLLKQELEKQKLYAEKIKEMKNENLDNLASQSLNNKANNERFVNEVLDSVYIDQLAEVKAKLRQLRENLKEFHEKVVRTIGKLPEYTRRYFTKRIPELSLLDGIDPQIILNSRPGGWSDLQWENLEPTEKNFATKHTFSHEEYKTRGGIAADVLVLAQQHALAPYRSPTVDPHELQDYAINREMYLKSLEQYTMKEEFYPNTKLYYLGREFYFAMEHNCIVYYHPIPSRYAETHVFSRRQNTRATSCCGKVFTFNLDDIWMDFQLYPHKYLNHVSHKYKFIHEVPTDQRTKFGLPLTVELAPIPMDMWFVLRNKGQTEYAKASVATQPIYGPHFIISLIETPDVRWYLPWYRELKHCHGMRDEYFIEQGTIKPLHFMYRVLRSTVLQVPYFVTLFWMGLSWEFFLNWPLLWSPFGYPLLAIWGFFSTYLTMYALWPVQVHGILAEFFKKCASTSYFILNGIKIFFKYKEWSKVFEKLKQKVNDMKISRSGLLVIICTIMFIVAFIYILYTVVQRIRLRKRLEKDKIGITHGKIGLYNVLDRLIRFLDALSQTSVALGFGSVGISPKLLGIAKTSLAGYGLYDITIKYAEQESTNMTDDEAELHIQKLQEYEKAKKNQGHFITHGLEEELDEAQFEESLRVGGPKIEGLYERFCRVIIERYPTKDSVVITFIGTGLITLTIAALVWYIKSQKAEVEPHGGKDEVPRPNEKSHKQTYESNKKIADRAHADDDHFVRALETFQAQGDASKLDYLLWERAGWIRDYFKFGMGADRAAALPTQDLLYENLKKEYADYYKFDTPSKQIRAPIIHNEVTRFSYEEFVENQEKKRQKKEQNRQKSHAPMEHNEGKQEKQVIFPVVERQFPQGVLVPRQNQRDEAFAAQTSHTRMTKKAEHAMNVLPKHHKTYFEKVVFPANQLALTTTTRPVDSILADLKDYDEVIFGVDGAYFSLKWSKDPKERALQKIALKNALVQMTVATGAQVTVLYQSKDKKPQWVRVGNAVTNGIEMEAYVESWVHDFVSNINSFFGTELVTDHIFNESIVTSDFYDALMVHSQVKPNGAVRSSEAHKYLCQVRMGGEILFGVDTDNPTRKMRNFTTGCGLVLPGNQVTILTSLHLFTDWPLPTDDFAFEGSVEVYGEQFTNEGPFRNAQFRITRVGWDAVILNIDMRYAAQPPEPPKLLGYEDIGPAPIYAYVPKTRGKKTEFDVIYGQMAYHGGNFAHAWINLQPGDSGTPVFTATGHFVGVWFGSIGRVGVICRPDPELKEKWPLGAPFRVTGGARTPPIQTS